jgi:truncated hemoglobin YjbI
MKYALLLVISAVAILGQRIPTDTQTFTVTTAFKTAAHPYFQQGFAVGYKIDNSENPNIALYVGRTYTFYYNGSCIHPLYISSDPSGQGVGVVTDGITKPPQVCRDTPNLVWKPTAAQVGQTFYYQCVTHSKMGWQIQVTEEPFCDKYSRLLGVTNEALVSNVVGDVFVNLTKPNADLLEFFDGTTPPGSTDFTDPANSAATNKLAANLVAFFGIALGCPDPAFPKYNGNPDMKVVHQNIPIGQAEFDSFNNLVIAVMAQKGVSKEDQAAALGVLNTLQPDICNDANSCKNSFCDRYSRALNVSNVALMTTVVTNTFKKAIDPKSGIKGFFDGTVPPNSVDFINNAQQQTRLVNNLVAFFGGVLQCTDAGFPTYTANTDLADVHKSMPIGTAEFNTFNGALLLTLKEAGVSENDRNFVKGYLESTKKDICNQPDCSGNVQPGIKFVLDVVPKVKHPYTGQGFASGFQVDGLEGRPLNLIVGKVYSFQNNGACQHPVYISTSDNGIGEGEVNDGVVYPGGNKFGTCNGAILTFTPTSAQVNQNLFYQCRNHAKMGYTIKVFNSPNDIPVTTGSGTITIESAAPQATTGAPATTAASTPDEQSDTGAALLPSLLFLVALLALFF